jgi:hypothetical protein
MLPPSDIQHIVHAIYIAEGGSHTKHPYGILSVHTKHPAQVCQRTIEHAAKDYKAVKVDRCFIHYLASRYCPASSDLQGNVNWNNNVIRILHIQ